MSKRKRLTKQKFYAINRDLKVHSKVKDVAAVHSVSEETVRNVKRAKTWPRFQATKKLKNEQRRTLDASKPIKAVAVQQSLGTDLEQLDKITQEPANQIQPLPSEEVKIVTVQEWEYLNRKVGRLYSLIGTPKRNGLLDRVLGRR